MKTTRCFRLRHHYPGDHRRHRRRADLHRCLSFAEHLRRCRTNRTAKWSCAAVSSSRTTTSFPASAAVTKLDHICPNIAFISAAGLSLQHGATCFNFDELEMKHRAMAMAQQKIRWQTTASSAKPNRPASAPDAVRSGDQRPPAGRRLHGVLQRQRHRYPLLIRLLRRRNRRRTAAIFFPRPKRYK